MQASACSVEDWLLAAFAQNVEWFSNIIDLINSVFKTKALNWLINNRNEFAIQNYWPLYIANSSSRHAPSQITALHAAAILTASSVVFW